MSRDRTKVDTAQTRNVLFSVIQEAAAASRYQTTDIAATPTMGKEDFAGVAPHQAGERVLTAKTGGIYPFRGQAKLTWRTLDTRVRFEKIEYKIEKGNNSGGNNANVAIVVIGASIATAQTDKGIQDGQWHLLATNLDVNLSSMIMLMADFIFDKSMADDPDGGAIDIIDLSE